MDLLGIVNFFQQRAFVGIKEIGKNKAFSDALFEQMMKDVGWRSGEAWCAALVKAVYMACFPFDRDWLSKNLGKGAYINFKTVIGLNSVGDKKYIAIRQPDPRVGDIACWQNGNTEFGHTGIVSEVITNTSIMCIEGNTSQAGVRDGDGVYENRRNAAIGASLGGLIFRGYIRRNFTADELERLKWDNNSLSYYLQPPVAPISAGATASATSQSTIMTSIGSALSDILGTGIKPQ